MVIVLEAMPTTLKLAVVTMIISVISWKDQTVSIVVAAGSITIMIHSTRMRSITSV